MSAIFLKRFLQRPFQVASIIPSSRTLIRRVVGKMDLSQPRVIVEYGPGEGCHTREIVSRMHPDSQVILFELDPELAQHLEDQFRGDRRVTILNTDAARLSQELFTRGHGHCDYVVSGIPFRFLEPEKKRELLRSTYECLAPHDSAAFIIYQYTNELVNHCRHFPRVESEYCVPNIPPSFITKFYKTANGSAHGRHGHAKNGHHRH
jgi:phospholipid N-methyltransferase